MLVSMPGYYDIGGMPVPMGSLYPSTSPNGGIPGIDPNTGLLKNPYGYTLGTQQMTSSPSSSDSFRQSNNAFGNVDAARKWVEGFTKDVNPAETMPVAVDAAKDAVASTGWAKDAGNLAIYIGLGFLIVLGLGITFWPKNTPIPIPV